MTDLAVKLTLPDTSDASHFVPLQILLEALTRVNEYHCKRARRCGLPVPPIYTTGVRYIEEDGAEEWPDLYGVLKRGGGDCVPAGTLVLRDDFELVPIVDLDPGDRILGENAWTEVRECVVTGEKQILAFDLSNGCVLRCSPEHRLFRDVDGQIEEARARDVRVGDDLVTARSVPLASRDDLGWPDPLAKLSPEDRSWLLGVLVADGWAGFGRSGIANRVGLSGLDGAPKEAQKQRAEALMSSVGVATRWHRKYLAINDGEIARFFATCGHRAPNKHVPSLRFASDVDVRAVIEGLAADSTVSTKSGSRTHSTTSATLALQLRVLYRMLGISTSVKRWDEHGGLGSHPIYHVIPRERTREGYAERRDKAFARVRGVRDDGIELCADIETDSGKFWLPESDVLVHNCEDLAAWRAGELRAAGVKADPVLKWRWVDRREALAAGLPIKGDADGLWLVHCLVRFPDGTIEDPSKILGMGGAYTRAV
jgi:hypothetical protein